MDKWLKWKTWNDQLALLLIVGIPFLWMFGSRMPSEATGATIVIWTLVANFYFRRKPTTP